MPDYQSLINRLRKNQRQLRRLRAREEITAYRLYDRDIPQFPFAIDRYGDAILLQEYETGWQIDDALYQAWIKGVVEAVMTVTEVKPEAIYRRIRQRQKGLRQYEKEAASGKRFIITEKGRKFWINLTQYLDTGLFLDHRPTRAWVGDHAQGLRFLNLFCYTASFTVYAATGGSIYSESVDLSNTYLTWARDNFYLNEIDVTRHQLIRQDAFRYLEEAGQEGKEFDLIVLDPPTFSNSKKMRGVLDIEADHKTLITGAMNLLTPQGTLIFSTNLRGFTLDPALCQQFRVTDKTDFSIPPDFRSRKIHQCWWFSHP